MENCVSWNRCFICSELLVSNQPEEDGSSNRKLSQGSGLSPSCTSNYKITLKYLLGEGFKKKGEDVEGVYKDVLELFENSSIGQPNLLRFCENCEKNADNMLELQLELERIQMKMVDKLKLMKKSIFSNSWLYGSNLEVKEDFERFVRELEEKERESSNDFGVERRFLDVVYRFTTSLFETDLGQISIPLVYLEKYTGSQNVRGECVSEGRKVAYVNKVPARKEDNVENNEGLNGVKKEVEEQESIFRDPDHMLVDLPLDMGDDREETNCTKETLPVIDNAITPELRFTLKRKCKLAVHKTLSDGEEIRTKKKKIAAKIKKSSQVGTKLKCLYPGCPQEFSNGMKRKSHIKVHKNTWACPHCDKSMASLPSLKSHISSLHNNEMRYKCQLCPKRFNYSTQLKNHKMLKHGIGEKYKCELCPKEYSTFSSYYSHMKGPHQQGKVFKCDVCHDKFKDTVKLEGHRKTHSEAGFTESKVEKAKKTKNIPDKFNQLDSSLADYLNTSSNKTQRRNFQCRVCSFGSWDECSIQQHLKNHEEEASEAKIHDCPDCNSSFSHKQSLAWHLLTHSTRRKCEVCGEWGRTDNHESHLKSHDNPIYYCEFCTYCCSTFKGLVLHARIPKGASMKCQLCLEAEYKPVMVTKKISLLKHLYKSHGCTELMLKCDYPGCEEEFYDVVRKQNHMNLHLNRYPCPVCQKQLASKHGLKKHIEEIHEEEERFHCNLCQQRFRLDFQLEVHKIKEHGGDKFKCELCPPDQPKEYTTRAGLLSHKKFTHGVGVVPTWECSICMKVVQNKPNSIRNHMRLHSDVKEFTCDVCGFATRTSKLLQQHMLQHGGKKKLKCRYCPKTFFQVGHIKCHERTHTGEKPYQCEQCGAAYSQSSQLRLHNKKNHPDENKPQSSQGFQSKTQNPSHFLYGHVQVDGDSMSS